MLDSCEEWTQRIQASDRRAIARAISAIESADKASIPLLKRLYRAARRTRVIGVTGAPGAGKSTLVEKLASAHRRSGERVGILAVDPTSPFSGGAILGDRIRMQSLSSDEGVYIRSMATRGALGGLAMAAWDAVTVLEAAGCETVFVETVGVGQDEVEIARLADVTILLLVPGMGDDVQTFKAGVMEIADIFVMNKADRGGADRAEREIAAFLSMAPEEEGWRPPIVRTVASSGEGVEELCRAIDKFFFYAETPLGKQRKRERWRMRILQMMRQKLLDRVAGRDGDDALIASRVEQIIEGRTDPYTAVEELIKDLSMDSLSH